jgi:hypothetical protein
MKAIEPTHAYLFAFIVHLLFAFIVLSKLFPSPLGGEGQGEG